MAVEASHLNIFPPQLVPNRDFVYANQGNVLGYNSNAQMGSVAPPPMVTGLPETLLPLNQSIVCDSLQPKTSINTDSGLTYNVPAQRKRSRDSFDQLNTTLKNSAKDAPQFPFFLGERLLPQIQQYQLDIDSIISHHSKKIRMELEERQKQQARLLVAAIGEGVMKKLKEKDEQIQRMGKLNLALQERVKSLYIENQLWRDLAQSNEATANSLRTNLEQILAHVSDERLSTGGVAAAGLDDDAESCCGSNFHLQGGMESGEMREAIGMVDEEEEEEASSSGQQRKLAIGVLAKGGMRKLAKEAQDHSDNGNRRCRMCGARESCVLLLPCRHLCLCTVCGSTLHQTCPVCNNPMNATVHVNMSS